MKELSQLINSIISIYGLEKVLQALMAGNFQYLYEVQGKEVAHKFDETELEMFKMCFSNSMQICIQNAEDLQKGVFNNTAQLFDSIQKNADFDTKVKAFQIFKNSLAGRQLCIDLRNL